MAEPTTEVLRVESLVKEFAVHRSGLRGARNAVRAVNDVSLTLRGGQTLGLVGESGCGKSTTGRTIMRLLEPNSGRIFFEGRDVTHLKRRGLSEVRRGIQIVLQDPFASLDPRMTVRDLIAEPLHINKIGHRADRAARVEELLELVGLDSSHASRYPHQMSGGQRQRVSVARALAMEPKILILDEPVSALDVSLQAQVISLLTTLQKRLGIAYIFISHDLSVVRYMCDSVAVMYLGRIVESGSVTDVFDHPSHPYTQALLSSVPIPDPDLRDQRPHTVLSGDVPSPSQIPSGCGFRSRCPQATDVCRTQLPLLIENTPGHEAACHHPAH